MLTDHFWLFCGVWVGGLSFIFGKVKSKPLVETGEYSKSEVNKYLRGFGLAIFIPSMVFWGLQQSISPPVSVDFFSWPNPQFFIAILVLIGLRTILLIWVLFFEGSLWLSRCLRLVGNFPQFLLRPNAVKALTVLIVLIGVSSILIKYVQQF